MLWLRFPEMRTPLVAFVLSCTLFSIACGSSRTEAPGAGASSSGGGASSSSGGSGASSSGGGFNNDGTDDAGAGNTDECTDAARLIYVLSAENDLYSFQPVDKKFTKIGALGCSASGMSPNSMAVDRDAVAYVNYVKSNNFGQDTAGAIYKVSTTDASCTKTDIALPSGFFRIGMGFATDGASAKSETLYVAATGQGGLGNGQGLGKIDLASNTLVKLGQFSGSLSGQAAELTGTGDARLFAFFTTSPVKVAEVDKTNGATSNVKTMSGVETPSAWAFSFWGGDLWLYTAPDASNPSRTTNVTHYTMATGDIDTKYMTNVGFRIVGAGVSTCAPVAPVK